MLYHKLCLSFPHYFHLKPKFCKFTLLLSVLFMIDTGLVEPHAVKQLVTT
jgi:hypothetical protein